MKTEGFTEHFRNLKGLNKRQKIILAVICAILILAVAALIAVGVANRKDEPEMTAVPSVVPPIETDATLSAATTTAPPDTTAVETTVLEMTQTNTTRTAATTAKAETAKGSDTNDGGSSGNPQFFFTPKVIAPDPAFDADGSYSVSSCGAESPKKSASGNYAIEIWAVFVNTQADAPANGRVSFFVTDFDGKTVGSGSIDVGVLQPGEDKRGSTTYTVEKNAFYQIYFYI